MRICGDEPRQPGGRLVGKRLGPRNEQDLEGPARRLDFPKFPHIADEVQPRPQRSQVIQQILADPAHHLPQRLARLQPRNRRETPQQRGVDWRVKFKQRLALHSEPARCLVGAARVEPFRRFQPVAKRPRVLVNPEMLQNQTQRASRRIVLRKLVVIEISPLRRMLVADVHHRSGQISKILRQRLAAQDRHGIFSKEQTAGEKLVLMRAAGVGQDLGKCHWESGNIRRSRSLGSVLQCLLGTLI